MDGDVVTKVRVGAAESVGAGEAPEQWPAVSPDALRSEDQISFELEDGEIPDLDTQGQGVRPASPIQGQSHGLLNVPTACESPSQILAGSDGIAPPEPSEPATDSQQQHVNTALARNGAIQYADAMSRGPGSHRQEQTRLLGGVSSHPPPPDTVRNRGRERTTTVYPDSRDG